MIGAVFLPESSGELEATKTTGGPACKEPLKKGPTVFRKLVALSTGTEGTTRLMTTPKRFWFFIKLPLKKAFAEGIEWGKRRISIDGLPQAWIFSKKKQMEWVRKPHGKGVLKKPKFSQNDMCPKLSQHGVAQDHRKSGCSKKLTEFRVGPIGRKGGGRTTETLYYRKFLGLRPGEWGGTGATHGKVKSEGIKLKVSSTRPKLTTIEGVTGDKKKTSGRRSQEARQNKKTHRGTQKQGTSKLNVQKKDIKPPIWTGHWVEEKGEPNPVWVWEGQTGKFKIGAGTNEGGNNRGKPKKKKTV